MNLSALSLALIPLCFAYAIVRYRLMDVDIIFKRGLAYTAATGGVVAVYVALVAVDRRAVSHGVAERACWAKSLPSSSLRSCFSPSATGPRRAWIAFSTATASTTAAP